MVGLLVALSAAACDAADTSSPSQLVTTRSTPNLNPDASNPDALKEADRPTAAPSLPTVIAAPNPLNDTKETGPNSADYPSNDTKETGPNSADYPSTVGQTADDGGVEKSSDLPSPAAGESTRPKPNLQAQEDPPAVEPSDAPTEAFRTSLDSTREVEVDFRRFRQLIPRDTISPVYRPKFVPAQSAGLTPQELVIGVAINGESKAYPVGKNLREP